MSTLRVYTQADWDDPTGQSTHSFLAPVLPQLGIDRFGRTEWAHEGSESLMLVEQPEDADVISLPDLYYTAPAQSLREAAALADDCGRPLVLFGHTDHYR